MHPKCKYCNQLGPFVAAQSVDQGHTIEWLFLCPSHVDGGDWDDPIYELVPAEGLTPSTWNANISLSPDGFHEFFLIRPKGIDPRTGKHWIPTIVQRSGKDFYSPDNEIEPLYFGQNEAEDHPLKTELEWTDLPA